MASNVEAVNFYAPEYLRVEMERHLPKIVNLTGQSEATVREIISLCYTRIQFIADSIIPIDVYVDAARLVRDVDPFDVQFVALARYLGIPLWTGDLKLHQHLISIGFTDVVTFEELKDNGF